MALPSRNGPGQELERRARPWERAGDSPDPRVAGPRTSSAQYFPSSGQVQRRVISFHATTPQSDSSWAVQGWGGSAPGEFRRRRYSICEELLHPARDFLKDSGVQDPVPGELKTAYLTVDVELRHHTSDHTSDSKWR